jgi:hypothetical protein
MEKDIFSTFVHKDFNPHSSVHFDSSKTLFVSQMKQLQFDSTQPHFGSRAILLLSNFQSLIKADALAADQFAQKKEQAL